MKPIILFRRGFDDDNEIEIAAKYFDVVEQRSKIPENSLVIGRYSCLPFYKELEEDVFSLNSKLINSHKQHIFIAENILEWANNVLVDLTPSAFDKWGNLPEGSYVVKGKTNSKKFQWDTHMFAPTKGDIAKVVKNLLDDTFINQQGLIVRPYFKLKQIDEAINGLPITNEWRFFFYKDQILSYGFYWAIIEDPPTTIGPEGINLAKLAAKKVSEHVDFFVLDVAQKENGEWIVIEINDAQMAGLSLNDPNEFYGNLKLKLTNL